LRLQKGARLKVSGAWLPRVAEQLEAAMGARLELSGARRPRAAEQLEAAKVKG